MQEAVLFPGQVERLEFDLAQITAIASFARSEVFWTFNPHEPLSVADVAQRMGKPVPTVNYHVNALSKVGLIIPVASRRKGARTEKLYVHAGRASVGRGHPMTPEYRIQAAKGFAAILRTYIRERALLHRVLPHRRDLADFCIFQIFSVRVRREQAIEFRREMMELLRKYEASESDEGVKVRVAVIAHPEGGEIRAAYKEATGQPLGKETIAGVNDDFAD